MGDDCQYCSCGVPSFAECTVNCLYARPIMKEHRNWHDIISARTRYLLVSHARGKPRPKAQRSLEKILGYRFSALVAHVESEFREGMSWENIPEWCIDHIVPRCRFRIDGPTHPNVKRCWKLSNIQLLWPHENIRKAVNSWCVL